LVKRYHPDAGDADDPDMIRKINAAYTVIQDYLSGYQFSFTEGEFYEQNPEARLWQQFADDPLWGRKP
jgi:DnaJ-class molecular chaperone